MSTNPSLRGDRLSTDEYIHAVREAIATRRAAGSYGPSGGSRPAPGSMVWRGEFNPQTAYRAGDVVDAGPAVVVATVDPRGAIPTPPLDYFSTSFDGPTPEAVMMMGFEITGSGSSARAQSGDTGGRPAMLVVGPAVDGTITLSGVDNTGAGRTRVLALLSERGGSCAYDLGTGQVLLIEDGAETVLATADTTAPAHANHFVDLTVEGQELTVNHSTADGLVVSLTVSLPRRPAFGMLWGLEHVSDTEGQQLSVKSLQWIPSRTPIWAVLRQTQLRLQDLTDVRDAHLATEGQVLRYAAGWQSWSPAGGAPPTPPHRKAPPVTTTPTLDWASNHDERSRDYPVRELLPLNGHRHDRLWKLPPFVLDQGSEGACTGFAACHEALAEPVPVDLTRLGIHAPTDPTDFALFLYGMAKYLDEWKGENYSGTSTNAVAKAMMNAGLLKEYRWAFGLDDVIDTVIWKGPVIIGINWYDGMYTPRGGVLTKTGKLVGGHALCVVGYRKSSVRLGGKPAAVLLNSWGPDWGVNGTADISLEDLGALLAENGEAMVPVRRSYGR